MQELFEQDSPAQDFPVQGTRTSRSGRVLRASSRASSEEPQAKLPGEQLLLFYFEALVLDFILDKAALAQKVIKKKEGRTRAARGAL